MRIGKHFEFEASHLLPWYDGKCNRLHGHSYKLTVIAEGKIKKDGMVLDFEILKNVVKETVIDKYDHRHLNDYFENPTAENVAKAFYNVINKRLKEVTKNTVKVAKLRLYETSKSFAEVSTEDDEFAK